MIALDAMPEEAEAHGPGPAAQASKWWHKHSARQQNWRLPQWPKNLAPGSSFRRAIQRLCASTVIDDMDRINDYGPQPPLAARMIVSKVENTRTPIQRSCCK